MKAKILRIGVRQMLRTVLARGADWPDWIEIHRFAGVPRDAHVASVSIGPEGFTFDFVITHDSFPEVKEGEEVPEVGWEVNEIRIARLRGGTEDEFNLVATLSEENERLRGVFDDLRNDDTRTQAAFAEGVQRSLEAVMAWLTEARVAPENRDRLVAVNPSRLINALMRLKAPR